MTQQVSPARANLEIGAIGLGALMAALAQTLVIPVLPVIEADLGASTTESQWLLTSTLLVGAVVGADHRPARGHVRAAADAPGRPVGALPVGSLIGALTSNIEVMIVGRALVRRLPPRSPWASACWRPCCRRNDAAPRRL